MITEITFISGSLDVTLNNVQMDLSTTQRQPDGLSGAFTQNVGSDDTVVFSGPLHLFSRGFGNYDLHIPLEHPFLYDPNLGNLLLDVRNFQTIAPGSQPDLLADSAKLGDSSSLAIAFNVNSPTAQLGTAALLTEFTVTQVPEPSSVALFGAGLGLVGLLGVRRRRLRTKVRK